LLRFISYFFFHATGGEDFDQRVVDYFLKVYKKKTGKDARRNNRAVQKLRREAEKAKRALSSQQSTRVEIENFFEGRDFAETLTRAKFEELNLVSMSFERQATFLWQLCFVRTVCHQKIKR